MRGVRPLAGLAMPADRPTLTSAPCSVAVDCDVAMPSRLLLRCTGQRARARDACAATATERGNTSSSIRMSGRSALEQAGHGRRQMIVKAILSAKGGDV